MVTKSEIRPEQKPSWPWSWSSGLAVVLALSLFIPPAVHLLLTFRAGIAGTSGPLVAEAIDRQIWFLIVVLTALLVSAFLVIARTRRTLRTGLPKWIVHLCVATASSMWLLSISWTQVLPNLGEGDLWWGFGTFIALASLGLALIALSVDLGTSLHRLRPFLSVAIVAIVVVWYVPAIVQPPWGMFDFYHSRYIVNEVLAPLAGQWSFGSFAAQYTSLLGIPLIGLGLLFEPGANAPYFAIAIVWLGALALATIALIVATAYLVLPRSIRFLAPILTMPLILISQLSPSGYLGYITSLYSAYPGRMLAFAASAFFLVMRVRSGRLIWAASLGLTSGFGAVNNFEFGLTTLVALVLVLLLGRWLAASDWLAFSVSGLFVPLAYVTLVISVDGEIRLDFIAPFVLAFGSGFGNVAMPVVGTWTAIAGMLIAGTAVGVWVMKHPILAVRVPASLAAFAGFAGILQFGYYVGRSVTSGQLQIFLAHVALILVSFTAIGVSLGSWRERTPQVGLLLLVCALPIASLVAVRSPVEEWSRIVPINKGPGLLKPDRELEEFAEAIREAQIEFPGSKIGAAAQAGNYLALSTGASNTLVTSSPRDSLVVPKLANYSCDSITGFEGIVVTHRALAELPQPFCGLDATPYVNGTFLIIPSN